MTLSKKVIIIIPAFNEEKTIETVVKKSAQFAQEIIVVDDNSSDQTAAKATGAGAIVIRHEQNKGYDASLEDGFREAAQRGADIFVTCDADGQHNPEDIPRLTSLISGGQADVVIGQRQKLTHVAEKLFAFYTRIFFGIKDPLCGLKAYSRKVYEVVGHFDTLQSIGTQLTVEAIKRGFMVKKIPIIVADRRDTSRFYFKKLKANLKILKAFLKIVFLTK